MAPYLNKTPLDTLIRIARQQFLISRFFKIFLPIVIAATQVQSDIRARVNKFLFDLLVVALNDLGPL